MEIKLSDHFTYKRLFRFVIPSIVMMIFTSIYGVVDGFFVSNYVGNHAISNDAGCLWIHGWNWRKRIGFYVTWSGQEKGSKRNLFYAN